MVSRAARKSATPTPTAPPASRPLPLLLLGCSAGGAAAGVGAAGVGGAAVTCSAACCWPGSPWVARLITLKPLAGRQLATAGEALAEERRAAGGQG